MPRSNRRYIVGRQLSTLLEVVASVCTQLNDCYFWSLYCTLLVSIDFCAVKKKKFTLIIFPADTNECESSPCLNNGNCIDRINAFNCSCPPGFAGNRCEIGQSISFSQLQFFNLLTLLIIEGRPNFDLCFDIILLQTLFCV